LVAKGAPEEIVARCSYQLDMNNEVVDFHDQKAHLEHISQVIFQDYEEILKPLSYAYRDFKLEDFQKLINKYDGFSNETHHHVIESNLIFAATFLLGDPLRDDVEHVINDMWEAGTNTRILSGDHKETVLKAALKAGIIDPDFSDNDMSG